VPAELNDMEAVRQEILSLLRQQMEALDSPDGLTDDQLKQCYLRHDRVQELREVLQSASILAGQGYQEQEYGDSSPISDAA
jgi:hypothetical protein